MKKFALIVAGGMGKRMGEGLPKQFIPVGGKPLLMHTVGVFSEFDPEINIVIVLPEIFLQTWGDLCEKYNFSVNHKTCAGGVTRFESVKNGLSEINDDGIVFIHDGARPLVSQETLSRCFETAEKKGNALPVVAVSESIREIRENGSSPVDRSKYFLIQTPQTFVISEIKKAYNQSSSISFTDDATVYESAGGKINLVEGNPENIKITYPSDLKIAEALITKT